MSEYNKIQNSFFVNGDQIVVRADTPEEHRQLLEGMAKEVEASLKAINALKQAHVAAGVFTGDSAKKSTSSGTTKSRAKDAPPPAPAGDGETPTCEHGEMVDLRDRGYKSDFYCSLDTRDWKKKCKPVKVS